MVSGTKEPEKCKTPTKKQGVKKIYRKSSNTVKALDVKITSDKPVGTVINCYAPVFIGFDVTAIGQLLRVWRPQPSANHQDQSQDHNYETDDEMECDVDSENNSDSDTSQL